LLATFDHAAIRQPGDQRRQPDGGDRQHRFVEQRQASHHLPLFDQDTALQMARRDAQVGFCKAITDFRSARRSGVSRFEVARRDLLVDDR
jgi:hypothetical protein